MTGTTQTLEGVDMVAIPTNTATPQDLHKWYLMQDTLKKLKSEEMSLRKRIFATYFPAPVEGTNTHPLPQDWVLKGTYPVTREIDPGALQANKERFLAAGIPVDNAIVYKPSLAVSVYRTLTAEQMKLFDQCLIVKPGSPGLEIVLPAKSKKAGDKA